SRATVFLCGADSGSCSLCRDAYSRPFNLHVRQQNRRRPRELPGSICAAEIVDDNAAKLPVHCVLPSGSQRQARRGRGGARKDVVGQASSHHDTLYSNSYEERRTPIHADRPVSLVVVALALAISSATCRDKSKRSHRIKKAAPAQFPMALR